LRPFARPDTRFLYDFEEFIPDFEGSERLWGRLTQLPVFGGDGPVFVTPDNGLQAVRRSLLAAGRPMLQTIAVAMGFHFFPPGSVAAADFTLASTLDGAQMLAEAFDLDAVRALGRLDYVVTGACAADPVSGVRFGLGKGHGFFDTEWAILSELGLVDEATPVVICVHDLQVVDTGLEPLLHDTAGDWILTPRRTIHVRNRHRNPVGVDWDLVDSARLAEIRPLRLLKVAAFGGANDQEQTTDTSGGAGSPETRGTEAGDVQALVREKVWGALRLVARPDSRFHWDFGSFIADFDGSEVCAQRLRELRSWQESEMLFVTPDNSTEAVRVAAIEDRKPFMMTTYGIRRGFLYLDPELVSPGDARYAATLDGMDTLARPVSLGEVCALGKVGLLVTGGSAVNLRGLRIGKGHGYFDLEWALLSEVGAVSDDSEVVDVVHDCQVVDVPIGAADHDVRVDLIVTPTRTIRIDGAVHPLGRVRWELVAGTEFELIPPVMELAQRRQGGEHQ
jgi:5-formyltetrahydrofolate cyclo-ligase